MTAHPIEAIHVENYRVSCITLRLPRSRVHAFARSRVLSPRCVLLHVAASFAPVEARSRCALTEPEHRAIERANARTRERANARTKTRERANENAQPITRSSGSRQSTRRRLIRNERTRALAGIGRSLVRPPGGRCRQRDVRDRTSSPRGL